MIKRTYRTSTQIVRCNSGSKAISPLIASQFPSKAIPINSTKGLLNKITHLTWKIHDTLSRIQPKGSAIMGFKKRQQLELPKTTVDEVYIISKFKKVVYCSNIVYYNKGPNKLREIISQIRRNHSGHKFLFKNTKYKDISLNTYICLNVIKNYILKHPNEVIPIFIFLILQIIGRTLGFIDYLFNNNKVLWPIAKSTKKLI